MNRTYVEIYRRHTITSENNEKLKRVTKNKVVLAGNLTTMEAVNFINKRTGSNKDGYDFGTPIVD